MIINFVAAVSVFFVSVAVFLKVYLSKKRQILNINEKFVFITGCDAGFGQQATIALDALGFHVFAACFTREGEYHLQTVCSNRVRTLRLDVTEHESIEDAYSKVTEVLPSNTGLWGLVNNAGILVTAPLEWQPLDTFKRTADVNLWGLIDVTKTFLPLIKKAKGRVVNMSSIAGFITMTNFASYCVTKFGLEGFSDALRREMLPWGVVVSVICPGTYKTAMLDAESHIRSCHNLWLSLSDDVRKEYGEQFLQNNDAMLRAWCCSACPDISKVTDAVIHALTSSTPKPRYKPNAWPFSLLPWLPTRLGDKMLQLLIKQPVPLPAM